MTGYPTPTFDSLTLTAPLSPANGGTGQISAEAFASSISAAFYTPTIASLRALTSTTTSTTCNVASYATPGDQGGGTFVVDANDTSSGATFTGSITPVSPPAAPSLSSTSGGTLAATTYYVKTTYTTAAGQTLPSAEDSLAVAADNLLVVASPVASTGATAYDVYVSTSTGTETLQASGIAIGNSWTEPTSGLVAGAALPSASTAGSILDVTALNTGSIVVNNQIFGTSVAAQTMVVAQAGGTGGAGNYLVSGEQTVASEFMTSDNGGTIIVDQAERRWYRQFSGAISVRWFGAAGDGTTNDIAAFNNAYAFLISKSGGTLLIQEGTYALNSTWELGGTSANQDSANIYVTGAGNYSTILDFTNATASTDGIQILGCSRIRLQGFTVKNARAVGINVNAGVSPGGTTYVSRFTLKDLIVDGALSYGILQANTYMGLMEDIECRNCGADGFRFTGDHTSITAIRCWAGGDSASPNGGNAGYGWYINGIVYSTFIGCASDHNTNAGWYISNCAGVSLQNCGAESNQNEVFFVLSTTTGSSGAPVTGVQSLTLTGCFGYNNSLASVNGFANFLGAETQLSTDGNILVEGCSDLLAGTQTISNVFNGDSGNLTITENANTWNGGYSYSGTVISGDYLTATGSATSLTNGVAANVGAATLTLGPGDWDVWGYGLFTPASTTDITDITIAISTTSANTGAPNTLEVLRFPSFAPGGPMSLQTPMVRIRSTSSTPVYLVAIASFSTSTLSVSGGIFARKSN